MTKQTTVTLVAFLLSAAWLLLHAMQGFSFLDIGMYMSGYQYFNAEPRPSFFLGQWLMSYECTGWLTETLHLHGYYALRVMRVVWFMVLQAILFVYLKRYLPWRYLPQIPTNLDMIAGFAVVLILRLCAAHFHWSLPKSEGLD